MTERPSVKGGPAPSPLSSTRDVMRQAGDDDAGETGYGECHWEQPMPITCTVTVAPRMDARPLCNARSDASGLRRGAGELFAPDVLTDIEDGVRANWERSIRSTGRSASQRGKFR